MKKYTYAFLSKLHSQELHDLAVQLRLIEHYRRAELIQMILDHQKPSSPKKYTATELYNMPVENLVEVGDKLHIVVAHEIIAQDIGYIAIDCQLKDLSNIVIYSDDSSSRQPLIELILQAQDG